MNNETQERDSNLTPAEHLDKKIWHAPELRKSEIRDRTGLVPDGDGSITWVAIS
jgi:hypothetical protein